MDNIARGFLWDDWELRGCAYWHLVEADILSPHS